MASLSMLERAAAGRRGAKHMPLGGARATRPAAAQAVASPARKGRVQRDPAALDATLARCVARRAGAVPAPPGFLQRSCLKATERDGMLYLDEPDKGDVERQGAEDGSAVQALELRGGFMIALARARSQPPVVYDWNPVDDRSPVEDRSPRSWGSGKAPRKKYSYRYEPYSTERLTSTHVRGPRMVMTKATAVGDVKAATANTVLTVNGATHTVKAWNTGMHGAKTPDQHYSVKYPLGGHSTASQAKVVRSHTRWGSGVGATRPNNWTTFTALLGMKQNGQIAGRMRWVQGHFINEHLGGRGEQQNLAPFTRSLNTRHYHAVEKHVIKDIKAGKTVDYSVKAIPGVPGSQNETDSIAWHRAARANYPQSMINTMVAVGALDAADGANLTAGVAHPGTTATPASSGPTLADVETNTETWITNYVQAAFPRAIACRVRYYSPMPTVKPPKGKTPTVPPPVPMTTKGTVAAHSAKSVGEVVIDNRR